MSSPYSRDVVRMLDQFVAHLLLQISRSVAERRNAIDHVHDQMKAVRSFRTHISNGVVVVPSSL